MKGVILLIVEGISEETALSVPLLSISGKVMIEISHGDFLYNNDGGSKTVLNDLGRKLTEILANADFIGSDILKVAYLIDMDGVFVKDNCYSKNKNSSFSKIQYNESGVCIPAKKKIESHLKTIHSRQEKIKRLALTPEIKIPGKRKSGNKDSVIHEGATSTKVPFSLYYMSCNLEHVTIKEQNVIEDKDKKKYAFEFSDKHKNDLAEFFNDDSLCPNDNYKDSWEFIQERNNSLQRFSNFNIFINSIIEDL